MQHFLSGGPGFTDTTLAVALVDASGAGTYDG